MPLFFFHLRGPKGLERDELGLECAGVEAAYLEAYRTIPEMSAELACNNANPTRHAFEIRDESGHLLMEVPFTEVLDPGSKPTALSLASQLREAAAEMARTADLISSLRKERAALRATLAETKRLLALARNVGSSWP